ncbi:MAG: hypothetical protein E6J91_30500 [Deltaproteobacteria bacterium]|nr:MAG: hypothetical protein E6J91_30500 [Deltaproteobacteria bacterium]
MRSVVRAGRRGDRRDRRRHRRHRARQGGAVRYCRVVAQRGGDAGASFVAIDHVQAGVGDRVVVLTEGNGVRQILKIGDIVPIRSIIVGIVDHVEPA